MGVMLPACFCGLLLAAAYVLHLVAAAFARDGETLANCQKQAGWRRGSFVLKRFVC